MKKYALRFIAHVKQKKRLTDFSKRLAFGSESTDLYIHSEGYGEYIPVHPFADEETILARLGAEPESCRVVDAYWRYHSDIHFVQSWAAQDSPMPPGNYVRNRSRKDDQLLFLIVLTTPFITRAWFEEQLTIIVRTGCFQKVRSHTYNRTWTRL